MSSWVITMCWQCAKCFLLTRYSLTIKMYQRLVCGSHSVRWAFCLAVKELVKTHTSHIKAHGFQHELQTWTPAFCEHGLAEIAQGTGSCHPHAQRGLHSWFPTPASAQTQTLRYWRANLRTECLSLSLCVTQIQTSKSPLMNKIICLHNACK